MKNIVLTGFMASGKTTVGMCVAEKMQMKFIDTDKLIEEEQNMTINDIFDKYGEPYFRRLEHECAVKLSMVENAVIATGGGFVLDRENINVLRKNSIIFNLKTNADVIKIRLDEARGTRPLLKNGELEDIMKRFEAREQYYENCDFVIELDCVSQPYEYAGRIIESFKQL